MISWAHDQICGFDCLWHIGRLLIGPNQRFAGDPRRECGGTQCRRRCSARVRSAAEGAVRGTQCRRRHSAEVRRVTEEQVAELCGQMDSAGADLSRGTEGSRTSGAEIRRIVDRPSADLRNLDIEELRVFAGLYW